eukprot:scaffold4833_cov105-Isochrysis_galbana.AAC.1
MNEVVGYGPVAESVVALEGVAGRAREGVGGGEEGGIYGAAGGVDGAGDGAGSAIEDPERGEEAEAVPEVVEVPQAAGRPLLGGGGGVLQPGEQRAHPAQEG